MTRKFECYSGCGFISVDAYTIEVIDGLAGVCPVCCTQVSENNFSEIGPVDAVLEKIAFELGTRLTAILAADPKDPAHTVGQRLQHEAARQKAKKEIE